jgi:hypothetical protein
VAAATCGGRSIFLALDSAHYFTRVLIVARLSAAVSLIDIGNLTLPQILEHAVGSGFETPDMPNKIWTGVPRNPLHRFLSNRHGSKIERWPRIFLSDETVEIVMEAGNKSPRVLSEV